LSTRVCPPIAGFGVHTFPEVSGGMSVRGGFNTGGFWVGLVWGTGTRGLSCIGGFWVGLVIGGTGTRGLSNTGGFGNPAISRT